jgi:NAD dependent epimerase/dehydratase
LLRLRADGGGSLDDFLKDASVLVTGAGGFIGSHLVEALLNEGARVRAFVRYNSRGDTGLLGLLPAALRSKIDLIAGDLRDRAAVSEATDGCELVFHLGALISIPYSYHYPADVAETNFLSTLNVLMACRQSGVKRLVHASSSEVYGSAQRVPINEDHPLRGQSPYSASKIGADKLVESFVSSFDLPAVTVRPFNTYGPRQSARAVIPTIITQALLDRHIRLGNLKASRDFTYISDTVDGFVQAAQAQIPPGKVYNLGTGQEISIGELAQKIGHIVGHPIDVVVDPARLRPDKSEVMRLVSDNSASRRELSWSPKVPLDEGLAQTTAWIGEHLGLYHPARYEV